MSIRRDKGPQVRDFTDGRVAPVVPATTYPELTQLLQRIVDVYDPLDIYLFGSRARGDASQHSDWDIMVVVSDDAPDALLDLGLGWQVQHGCGVCADVICGRITDFFEDRFVANTLSVEVLRDGIRLDLSAQPSTPAIGA